MKSCLSLLHSCRAVNGDIFMASIVLHCKIKDKGAIKKVKKCGCRLIEHNKVRRFM